MSFVLHWTACTWHFIADPRGASWIYKYFSLYSEWAGFAADDDGDDVGPDDFHISMVPFGKRVPFDRHALTGLSCLVPTSSRAP